MLRAAAAVRSFFKFGDGLALTIVTLLVCGPVLLGLLMIFVEPLRDPRWLLSAAHDPGKYPYLVFYVLFFAQAVLSYRPSWDWDDQAWLTWFGLNRFANLCWALAVGIILCLAIVDALDVGSANKAVYAATALTTLSIVLSWRSRWKLSEVMDRVS